MPISKLILLLGLGSINGQLATATNAFDYVAVFQPVERDDAGFDFSAAFASGNKIAAADDTTPRILFWRQQMCKYPVICPDGQWCCPAGSHCVSQHITLPDR